MKILVLDEDSATAEVLNEVAQLSGSKIINIHNIDEAKNVLLNEEIDAVVSERKIGNRPAVEILVYLRKQLNKDIPFIILSSSLTDQEKEYFTRLGADTVIEKPFNPLEVFFYITEILKERKGEEYVKERLIEEKIDKETAKSIIARIIEFIKKLLGIGKKD